MNSDTALFLDQVSVSLGGCTVVNQLSARWRQGQLVALIGPNGAGKTTLLRALAGLVSLRGTVELAGTDLASLEPRQRARRVAYLPQGQIAHWPLTVSRMVALGRLPHLEPWQSPSEADAAAIARAVDDTAVAEFLERPLDQLSGGERARVLLARALATETPLLLADEPTAALDLKHQLAVMSVLRRRAEQGTLVVAVLHDLALAANQAHWVALMDGGRLVAEGPPEQVLTADRLRQHYGIETVIGAHNGHRYVVPWQAAS